MSKIKVINKGYTITVVSWENDGDYYATKKITVKTLEEAKMYYHLMHLCKSKNNQSTGVIKLGNSLEFSQKQKEVIIDFFKNYIDVLSLQGDFSDADDYVYLDTFHEISGELLGYSEYLDCRVMESCTIIYSPEDIYLEEITFK